MAKKKNGKMGLTTGVGRIIVRTAVRKGAVTETYTTRFGFCGTFVPSALKKLSLELKNLCRKDICNQESNADRIISTARIYYSECEYILSDNETADK